MLYYLLVNLLVLSSVQGEGNILDEQADISQDGSEERERFCAPPVYDGMIVKPFKRSYADGETIAISCGEGYELNAWYSISAFLCSRGTFFPSITGHTCKESPGCKAPLEHGVIFSPQKAKYDIGENITISCIEGYELVGQDVYTCKRNKRFQGTDFSYSKDSFGFDPKDVCREIMDCDVVIQEGLHVEPFKRTYSPGEEIFLYCDKEYDLVVSNFSVCLNSGEFSFSPRRPCRHKRRCLPLPYAGLIVTPQKDYYLTGDEVTVSCREGYDLTGPEESVCGSDEEFYRPYDVHVDFVPHIGYGTCTEKPKCVGHWPRETIVTPDKDYYYGGDTVTVVCNEGYKLVGKGTTKCLAGHGQLYGQFSPNKTSICEKIVTCRAPNERGVILTPNKPFYGTGETVSISCESRYVLKAENESTCEAKKRFWPWTPLGKFEPEIDQDVCEKKRKCMSLHYAGLIVTPQKDYYLTGDEVTLSCGEGYDLTGPEESICGSDEEEGEFSRFYDIHVDFVPHIGHGICTEKPKCWLQAGYWPREAIVTPDKDYYYGGDTVTVSCIEGYKLVGKRTRKCLARHGQLYGHFSPDKTDICEKIVTCEAPDERGVILTPNKPFYETGETVSISCESRYVLMAANESTCETKKKFWPLKPRGKFEPDIDHDVCEKIPSCDKPQYEGLIVTPEQEFYAIGDKVTLSCEEGYEQRVAPLSTCRRRFVRNDGEFDPSLDDEEPCIKLPRHTTEETIEYLGTTTTVETPRYVGTTTTEKTSEYVETTPFLP